MVSEKSKKIAKFGFLGLIIIIVVAFSGFTFWAYTPPEPLDEALNALESSDSVEVTETSGYYSFEPKSSEPITGFIFYPGGRVDPRSYAPSAYGLAEQGYFMLIMKMPFNLAVFSIDAGKPIPGEFPQVQKWAIGGHSLGGAMAAQCVSQNVDLFDGLIFWASYPAANLSESDISVLSIYGTLDGLSTVEKIDNSRQNLPLSTVWVKIEGGNHANFGYYGDQAGDNQATITREQQQQLIISSTASFLSGL